YTLVARSGATIDRALPPAVLRTVEVPKYLDRPQILRRLSAVELAAGEFERWDEGFDDMVTRVLLEDLSLRLPRCPLALAGSAVSPAREREIAVALARFDADPNGMVVLEARWSIDRGGAGAPALRLERITRPSAAATRALAAAMSDCLGVLADRIAGALAA
ncbi:MAG: PqiC family protein, partial [Stellaceae bacterium]